MVKNLNNNIYYKTYNNFKIEYNNSRKIFYLYFSCKNKCNLLYENEFSEIEKEYSISNIGNLLILRDVFLTHFEAGYYFLLVSPDGKLISQLNFMAPYSFIPDTKSINWKNKRKLTYRVK